MFKRLIARSKHVVAGAAAAVVGVTLSATPSHAAVDLTGVTFPLTEIEAVAALILAALAGIWVIRRMFGLAGR